MTQKEQFRDHACTVSAKFGRSKWLHPCNAIIRGRNNYLACKAYCIVFVFMLEN